MITTIRIIVFIIIISLFGLFVDNYGQPKFSEMVIKVSDTNVVELRAKLYGKFDDFAGMNKSEALAHIDTTYDAGFWVENFRDLEWDSPSKPIGIINRLRINEGAKDTIVYSTTLANLPDTNIIVRAKFSPLLPKYVFRYTEDQNIGQRLEDYLCEPISVSLSDNRITVEKNDTVQIFAYAEMEDECTQSLTYSWEFRQDTSSVDSIVALGEWKPWHDGRNGHIEIADNYIKFEVMNNNWDRRQWRTWVSSGIGDDAKSENCAIRIKEK